jgi:hypothetical protein
MAGLEISAATRGRGRGRGIAPQTAAGLGRGIAPQTAPGLGRGIAPQTCPGLGRGIAPQTGPGLGRGSRSRVNWSGDATRPNPEHPIPSPAATAWDRVSASIFLDPSTETEKQQQLLDERDISENVLELRWEPVERDCYMLLANMLGDGKRASNFR